jgi:Probable cobalt transporter subunit (CbtA)
LEFRVIWRGALSGFIAGVLSFVFARAWAEPFINKAINYEAGRDAAITAVDKANGVTVDLDGPTIFDRTIQSTFGLATGIIAVATAMGALVAVAYLVLHARFNMRARTLALLIAGFGFLGVYLLPFVKYPANPPSIGHTFTIATRTALYLTLVGSCLVLLVGAIILGRKVLMPRFGVFHATLLAAAAFCVPYFILIALLPSLGHLHANVLQESATGYGASATETPLPITNSAGQLVYPGFPADVLWKFRWYSLLNQALIWATIGLIFSNLVERVVGPEVPVHTDEAIGA